MIITVNTTDDELVVDGDCSLREAIQAVNTGAPFDACVAASTGDHRIDLPAGNYVITIPGFDEDANATGDFDITAPVCVWGAGAGVTIVDGNDLDTVFHVYADTVWRDLTIQGGNNRGELDGGCMQVESLNALLMSDVVFRDCEGDVEAALNAGQAGSMRLERVSFIDNISPTADYTVGFASNVDSEAVLEDCLFSGNQSARGTLSFNGTGIARVERTLFVGNTSDTPTRGTVFSRGFFSRFVNVTWSGNTNTSGALVRAGNDGGGVVTLDHCTLTGNTGAATLQTQDPGDRIEVSSSIVSGNTVGAECVGPRISSADYNVVGTGCPMDGANDVSAADPMLEPLDDNGGLTATHAPLPGSPVIGAGSCDDDFGVALALDQRSISRPVSGCTSGPTSRCVAMTTSPAQRRVTMAERLPGTGARRAASSSAATACSTGRRHAMDRRSPVRTARTTATRARQVLRVRRPATRSIRPGAWRPAGMASSSQAKPATSASTTACRPASAARAAPTTPGTQGWAAPRRTKAPWYPTRAFSTRVFPTRAFRTRALPPRVRARRALAAVVASPGEGWRALTTSGSGSSWR